MPLSIPNLDDRSFEELGENARKLIPLYAPEWTDHNLHDPGITFIDLFAWLTEIELYGINQITDRHLLKYLKLLGIKPEPARAARVDLTFESNKEITLKEGTAVSAEMSGTTIYFELAEDITITPVELKKVIVDEQTGVFDRTSASGQNDLFYAPFGLNVQKGCTLYLGFDDRSDTLSFMCYLYERDLIIPGKHGDEEEYEFVNARFTWEISNSSDGTRWKSIAPKQDGTKGFKKSGKVLFENIDVDAWEKPSTIPVWEGDKPLYWLRCVIEESRFEYPPRIDTIRLNTVQTIHGRTIKDDVETRESNGFPHQAFKLAYTPVLNGTLGITVNGDLWKEVDDLDGSGPEDNHFILNREKGEIRFGDGLMGKVPPAGFKINVIQYRVGRGEDGNIKAGYRWKIEGYNDLIIQNLRDAAGGAGAETIEEARVRFLKDLKIPYTAVTSGDFEYIAKNTPGLRVAKAKAVPTYHPEKGIKENSITVVVIPFTHLESLKTPPEPSEGFKKAVCLHLDKHRLLGTEIHVISPLYVRADVNAIIVPLNGYPEEPLRSTIIAQLDRFLHPVRGWSDGKGWPIGRGVFRSEVYEEIEKIEGVDCVIRLSLSGDKGSIVDAEGNLVLPSKIATIYPGSHTVSVVRQAERCRKERDGNGRD